MIGGLDPWKGYGIDGGNPDGVRSAEAPGYPSPAIYEEQGQEIVDGDSLRGYLLEMRLEELLSGPLLPASSFGYNPALDDLKH